ncbi:MAG TPA: 3-dehydroquinate synthase [Trebonia sp.]|nr:3-dehydroquinate synthase [Trebonia sp.]
MTEVVPAGVTRIPVGGESPYEVLIGTGILGELPALVPDQAETVAVIHDERLDAIARQSIASLKDAGFTVVSSAVPSGEAAKTIDVAAGLWSWLGQSRVTRSDCVVGIGGGAATDLAGFVAATWLRGVPIVQVPTTVLGMVDAAVGGKTAVDIPEGKNLVGAFHPPAAVLCDLATLETLARPDYVAGLAEVIKAGFIADAEILRLVEEDPGGAGYHGGPHARELVERGIRVKARVVSADLREAGLREILNYGHTFGHAIERVEGYRGLHGNAVAIGMVFAAEVGWLAGRLDEASVARHRQILQSVGLPTAYPGGRWAELRAAMSMDKKSRGAALRMVVLDGEGHPGILKSPPESVLEDAYAAVSASVLQ